MLKFIHIAKSWSNKIHNSIAMFEKSFDTMFEKVPLDCHHSVLKFSQPQDRIHWSQTCTTFENYFIRVALKQVQFKTSNRLFVDSVHDQHMISSNKKILWIVWSQIVHLFCFVDFSPNNKHSLDFYGSSIRWNN